MAKVTKEQRRGLVSKFTKKMKEDAEGTEAFFVGLLWSQPVQLYGEYFDSLEQRNFLHKQWGFFYKLGASMYEEGIKVMDSISVGKFVKEVGLTEEYKEYGGYSTVSELINLVDGMEDNVEYYYSEIFKNIIIIELYRLFGDKVLIDNGNYQPSKMTSAQLTTYWTDKMNALNMMGGSRYHVENLVIDAETYLEKIEQESEDTIPYFRANQLNRATQGIAKGHVTMFGGFGNTGKTSFMSEKVVMSLIELKEKTVIILNEEDAQSFRHKIVLSTMFHFMKTGIDRARLVNGELQDTDKGKIREAWEHIEELLDGEDSLIKIIFMEQYITDEMLRMIRFWANRGYTNLIIDTHKVSDMSKHSERWVTFVEDMKSIYKITRKDAGGLNLRTYVTFQLADNAIKHRYLTFDAIGEGKASKNEASVVEMFRPVWSDEYEGGSHEITVTKYKKDALTEEYVAEESTLEKDKSYVLLFLPKNRFGQNNDNGQPVIVYESQMNANHFKEIGTTFIAKDFS